MDKRSCLKDKGILVLESPDEEREIEFELNYLLSLSLSQRILLMQAKSKELKTLLINNGHRETAPIIKRKLERKGLAEAYRIFPYFGSKI